MIEKRLLRVDEVAEILSCHPNTVMNLVRDGFIVAHSRYSNLKGLRIVKESVDIYIKTYQKSPEQIDL
jgi:hypothetical protein